MEICLTKRDFDVLQAEVVESNHPNEDQREREHRHAHR